MAIIWLMMVNIVSGWWLSPTPEKYEFVSWDDEIPNRWEKMFQTTKQVWFIYINRVFSENSQRELLVKSLVSASLFEI